MSLAPSVKVWDVKRQIERINNVKVDMVANGRFPIYFPLDE
jgi:hypothetical protein